MDSDFLRLARRVKQLEDVPVVSERIAGEMVLWSGGAAPNGWLLCDGTAISRADYTALFSVIGTAYGSGDGSTTFNLPNLKGRVAVGRDGSQTEFNTMGKTGGIITHVHGSINNLNGSLEAAIGAAAGNPSIIGYQHANQNTVYAHGDSTYSVVGTNIGAYSFNHWTKIYGATANAMNLPPYTVLIYIIKH